MEDASGLANRESQALQEPNQSAEKSLTMMTRYNAWCDELVFAALDALPPGEATKKRPTRFGTMANTLNHIYVIQCIFKAHLENRPHHFTARNTPTHPPLPQLWRDVTAIDQWYVDYCKSLSRDELDERIDFQFVGGGEGTMSRREIILHIVNHGSYHRGMVQDAMYHVPAKPPVIDLTVFLRDVPQPS